jgi:TPR repeat protein
MNKAAIFQLPVVLLVVLLVGGCADSAPPPGAPPPGAPPKVVLPIMAERGDAEAQVSLGWMYQTGQGFERDYHQAAHWYRAAADQGNGLAQYSLGELYAGGLGVAQDFAQAAAWHRRAAEGGNVSAQFRLAYFYENGLGVPRDYHAAAAWYGRAARGSQSAAGLPPNLVRLLGGGITPPALIQPVRQATEVAVIVPPMEPSLSGEVAVANPATAEGHWVHIASFRTRAAAALHWDTLGERHGDILAGLRGRLLAHDLGDDGAWIRLFAGPLDHAAAAAKLCEKLRARAIYCAVSAGF